MLQYKENKIEALRAAYLKGLTKAVQAKPEVYTWYPKSSIESVADKMMNAIINNGIGHVHINNSQGFTYACKELGIKKTYKAIEEWLNASD